MARSLLLLYIFLALTFFSTLQAAHHDEAVSHWKIFYPTIPIPPLVSQHISQMKSDEIDTVVSLIHTKTLSSNVPFFCKTAGLICSTDEIPKELLPNLMIHCYPVYNYQKPQAKLTDASAAMTKKTLADTRKKTLGVYFRESTLKNGRRFNMGEIKREVVPAKAFLPQSIASLLTLEQSASLFSNTTIGHMAGMTIHMCSAKTPGEETSKCLSSVEELVEFINGIYPDKRVKILYPQSTKGEHITVSLENIRPLLREGSNKFVACHRAFFPYTVMYCHMTTDIQVYQVDFVHPKTLDTINADMVAVCHRNTSSWSPTHVAIVALRTRPGQGEICHWMSTESMVFLHLDDTLSGKIDGGLQE
ncbi:hypothetical protein ACHQM5_013074 [Ranunculus cassubicifolius]